MLTATSLFAWVAACTNPRAVARTKGGFGATGYLILKPNMTKLWLDFETYSEVPITHGTHVYAAGAEIMLAAWALDDGPVLVEDFTVEPMIPDALYEALQDPAVEVWAQNSHFDRTVMRHAWGIEPALPRWRDTMVQALSHGLPGGLGVLCEILKVPTDQAKDKAGRQLIQLFCKPRPDTSKVRRATRLTHPAEWAKFKDEYAPKDIHAMREVHKRLPLWNYKGSELALWHLDQRINDRGVAIDMPLVLSAIDAVGSAQKGLAARTVEMTDGQVASTTQRDALLLHILEAYGIDLPDMQMATLERRIADPELPIELKELLGIRLQASTTSTSKYKTLLKGTSADGRLRGTLQFNGAARTGRWAGRLFQPQNLPRPVLKQDQIELGIDALKAGCADLVVDNVMELTSSAIRSCIVARKGMKLVVADLSNIEGRDQAWLAGEEWKLQAFRDFDNGSGPDLYKLAYSKSFGGSPDAVTKDQRQIGKVQELMLGYEGGVGAFITGAATYRFDIEELARQVLPIAPGWALNEASGFYDWTVKQGRSTFSLSRDAFVASDTVKRVWRNLHPNIAAQWGELKETALAAIECPGITMQCRRLKLRRDGSWLRIALPSGRALCYPSPQVIDGAITYMGMNQYSRKWTRLKSYGGKLFENVCQAVARDVMTANMPLIEAAGYEIVLTVHDEVICEAPDRSEFNSTHLSSLLAHNLQWAPDMPLAAAGFETDRYRKD
jgi:DNA polymerase bacteriophage-type